MVLTEDTKTISLDKRNPQFKQMNSQTMFRQCFIEPEFPSKFVNSRMYAPWDKTQTYIKFCSRIKKVEYL